MENGECAELGKLQNFCDKLVCENATRLCTVGCHLDRILAVASTHIFPVQLPTSHFRCWYTG